MIRLTPKLEIPPRECPNCHSTLTANSFLIVGMRNLADLHCPECQSEFYGDLPSGQGLYTPVILDKKTAAVVHDSNADWFADWLRDSFLQRNDQPILFETRNVSAVKNKVVLLNCLDVLYGHSLLKLLNAQYYLDFKPNFSLIILLPRFLEWLAPDDAAEIWTVDLPLRRGTEWNDWLAREIGERLDKFDEVFLSVAFSHPHPADFDIERFTKIAPLPPEKLGEHQNAPIVTFIWREDRLWETENNSRFDKLKKRVGNTQYKLGEQTKKIIEFAESLRREFPKLDFAVAGIGENGGLPDWIFDLRLRKLDANAEREWCERYAKSQIVVGVHGSNMLLPSAHAGGVIELIGADRGGNYLQDILFRVSDAREMLFRYRFVPPSTSPAELANLAATMLRYKDFQRLMSPEFSRHHERYDYEKWLMLNK